MICWLLAVCVASVARSAPLTEDSFAVPGLAVPNETPQEKFVRVDTNRDQIVSFDEFLHMDYVYVQAKKEEFDVIDADKDGRLSKPEYDEHYRAMNSRSDNLKAKYFGDLFAEFDLDSDLTLNQDEIRNVLAKRFLVQPRNNFGQIFYGFDTDHSGGLDLFEYMKLDQNFPFEQTDPLQPGFLPPVIKKVEKLPKFNELKFV